jgi:hypothetical protein
MGGDGDDGEGGSSEFDLHFVSEVKGYIRSGKGGEERRMNSL